MGEAEQQEPLLFQHPFAVLKASEKPVGNQNWAGLIYPELKLALALALNCSFYPLHCHIVLPHNVMSRLPFEHLSECLVLRHPDLFTTQKQLHLICGILSIWLSSTKIIQSLPSLHIVQLTIRSYWQRLCIEKTHCNCKR